MSNEYYDDLPPVLYEGDVAVYAHENALLRAEIERLRGLLKAQTTPGRPFFECPGCGADLAIEHCKCNAAKSPSADK